MPWTPGMKRSHKLAIDALTASIAAGMAASSQCRPLIPVAGFECARELRDALRADEFDQVLILECLWLQVDSRTEVK